MRKSPLLPIFLIILVDILGMAIILPLLPFYALHFGASAMTVGLLISSYAACQLFAGPILGRMSDTMGRKPLLIVSQIGTFIGFLVLARATVLWVVFLSRIIDGFTAGNLSLAQAYIADVSEPENRAKSFAVMGIAFGIGFLLGPGIAAFLSQYGLSAPIYAAAALSALSIVCTVTLLPKAIPAPHDAKRLGIFDWNNYAQYFARPGLGPLLWQFFIFTFAFSLNVSGFALFARGRYGFGAKQVGYVFTFIGFLGIIWQGGMVGRLVKIMGERKLVWTGFGSGAIGAVWLSFTRNLPQLLVNSVVASYGNVLRPALTSLVTKKAGKHEQGVVLGLTQSLTSVSAIVAPIISGALIDRGYLSTWAISAGAVSLVGMLISLRTAKEE